MKRILPTVFTLITINLAAAENAGEAITYSSVDKPGSRGYSEKVDAKRLHFQDAGLDEALARYKELSHRAIIRAASLPAVKITFEMDLPMNRIEALQTLDTVLSQNGVTMIPQGTRFMKAVPASQAATESPPLLDWPVEQLPDSGTYIQYRVELKKCRPRNMAQAIQPFAKMPNSIIAMDQSSLLILRDYSANIRRMLPLIESIDARYKEEPKTEERSAKKD